MTVEVLIVEELPGHDGQGTMTVVKEVCVLQVDVRVVRPPIQVLQFVTTVVV